MVLLLAVFITCIYVYHSALMSSIHSIREQALEFESARLEVSSNSRGACCQKAPFATKAGFPEQPRDMLPRLLLTQLALALLVVCAAYAQLHSTSPAEYHRLPSLREQATILDGWRDERVSTIPALLTKYRIDAWLVSSSCHACKAASNLSK